MSTLQRNKEKRPQQQVYPQIPQIDTDFFTG